MNLAIPPSQFEITHSHSEINQSLLEINIFPSNQFGNNLLNKNKFQNHTPYMAYPKFKLIEIHLKYRRKIQLMQKSNKNPKLRRSLTTIGWNGAYKQESPKQCVNILAKEINNIIGKMSRY